MYSPWLFPCARSSTISREKIDDYVEEWNNSDDARTLREYLGLTAEEEDVWIDDSDEALMELLDREKRA